ncbi:MAG: polyprenyl synthetase family protein [Planctomycetota bacterium]
MLNPSVDAESLSDATLVQKVDAVISVLIEGREFPARLRDAMLYAVLGPGKRVRPLLCVRSAWAVAGGTPPDDDVFYAAAALEMVHAFSLVHDDLPAMDDDDLRRGRPTVHKQFDEAAAVLAGDALQGLAMEALADLNAAWAKRAIYELARATNAMIAGQVLDTLGGGDASVLGVEERLRKVHTLKTGALLRAGCRMGALAGGGDDDASDKLAIFGNALGLMFQAVDDLLDVTSDAATLGKATQKDAEAGKLTYPGVFGVDGTRREIARLHEQAVAALASFGPSAEPLRAMAERLATRTR